MHVMVLNVPEHQANIDYVIDAFSRAEIGNVYSIVIHNPQPNGTCRIIVGLDWYKTSQTSHIWQGTILDETLKAQLCVTLTDRWVLIPVPIDENNNQLWQENVVCEWMNDTLPEPEVKTLDDLSYHTKMYTEYAFLKLDEEKDEDFGKPKRAIVPDHVVISVV
jgi:hypothetical protein